MWSFGFFFFLAIFALHFWSFFRLFFLSLMFVSFIILKQTKEGKENKWDSEAFKVTLGKYQFYSLTAK